MKIVIGTKNPGKIEGAKKALSNYFNDFEIEAVSVSSDVADQPVNEEIYIGSKNRVKNLKEYCKKNNISADLFIAVESGITNSLGRWMIINVAVIEDKDKFESYGTSAGFPVPDKYVKHIIDTNLNEVMNKIFNESGNSRGNGKGGIALLTKDKISRIDLTYQAFTMALTRYINEEWR